MGKPAHGGWLQSLNISVTACPVSRHETGARETGRAGDDPGVTGARTAMQQALFDTLPSPTVPAQRWWRLQGDSRRRGRSVEPLLVTPRFLARIDTSCCPITRVALGAQSARVVPLRQDASVAAGHLVTLGPLAAAACLDGGACEWTDAWDVAERLAAAGHGPSDGTTEPRQAGLDAAAWRRLAVLRSFVQPLTPAQAGNLPLLVLPPPRVRVLSPVQALQVAITLALRGADRAAGLLKMAILTADEDVRLALRVFLLTLLARCPGHLEPADKDGSKLALEDLWRDPLLQRRWQRLAARLTDEAASSLLHRARRQGLLGGGWRSLDQADAVDGWDLRSAPGLESRHAQATARAPSRLAKSVLAADCGGNGPDAATKAATAH